jgi:hypothetical protein
MNNLHSSPHKTAWQIERAKIFQRFCRQIQSQKAIGNSINKTAKRISRRWNGKPLKGHPSRRLAVSPATLFKYYRVWWLSGESFDSLFLKFVPSNRRLPAAVVIRFVNLCANRDFPSFKAAYLAFCQRGGNSGPGRVNGKRLVFGFDALKWSLPRGFWSEIKRHWQAIRLAEREIARLRLSATAHILAHVPVKIQKPKNYDI